MKTIVLATDFPIAQEGHLMKAIRSVVKAEQADLLLMSIVSTAPRSTQVMGSLATEIAADNAAADAKLALETVCGRETQRMANLTDIPLLAVD